ncbi:MAG: sulfotransferase family protein [Pirellulaceae bacterium]|jgi:hypothetical protein
MSSAPLPSKPYPGLVLHIGMPKTGTTTLQSLLFSCHSGIDYLGKARAYPGQMNCRSQEIYHLLQPLLWNVGEPWDPTALRRRWEAVLQARDPSKVLVGSWEGLGNSLLADYWEALRRVKATFGRCRLLICLRNPITLVPSMYLQALRGRHSASHRNVLGNHWFLDIEQWIARWRDTGGLDRLLSYAERIRGSTELLGAENVLVLLYEDLCQDQDQFVRAICQFLEVDEAEGLEHVQQGHLHTRISQDQIEFLRRVERSFVWRWWLNRKSPKSQRQVLDDHAGDGAPARMELPPQCVGVVADATREGNRWLKEHYRLDLEKYQYPL